MKIAIFQEQPYHSEIFGFLFNFFKIKKIIIDLYYDYISDPNSYFNFYKTLYDLKINIFKISDFKNKEKEYYKIIVTTIPEYYKNFKYPERIILVKHRKNQNIFNSFPIGLTQLVDKKNIFPLFPNHIKNKNKLSKNILIMGNFGYKNFNDLIENINIFNNYKFILVSRSLDKLANKYNHYTNLKFYDNLPTNQLIEMLYNDIDYYLLLNKIPTIYHKIGISGGVFQALSFGIPLICDKLYDNIYNYPESIVYKNSIKEILDKIENIDVNKYQTMRNKIINYVEEKIFNNNILLEKYINSHIKTRQPSIKTNIYLNKPFLKIIHPQNNSKIQIISHKKRLDPLPDVKNLNNSDDNLKKLPINKKKEEKNKFEDDNKQLIKNSLININLNKIKIKK